MCQAKVCFIITISLLNIKKIAARDTQEDHKISQLYPEETTAAKGGCTINTFL
jgi:hypothetical protein